MTRLAASSHRPVRDGKNLPEPAVRRHRTDRAIPTLTRIDSSMEAHPRAVIATNTRIPCEHTETEGLTEESVHYFIVGLGEDCAAPVDFTRALPRPSRLTRPTYPD